MGALRTARGKPEDPVMEEQRKTETFQEVTPYRLQVLMDLAARVVKLMTTGAWHLTFEEMDIVLDYIRYGMEQSRKKNQEGEIEDVFKNE